MKSQCPKCKSFKTYSYQGIIAISGGCLLVLGILLSFLVVPLLFIPLGIVMIVISFVLKGKVICNNCGYKFKKNNYTTT